MIAEGWEAVIGLEIHVQLNTATKMFCRCENRFGADPNTLTCPLCLGHPGVLPVANQAAVEKAVQIGLALDCEIAPRSQFHRKNYFYPDSPKAYQITQYDQPICGRGRLEVDGGTVGITRAHLEEDAAKLVHAGGAGGRIAGADFSLVDFNRCGTPLVEIVTEPDIRSPEQAVAFLTLLKNTLQTIGVSDCDMEKGSLRCDANVSVRPVGQDAFGTKTELKNMNSFKFLGEGMAAEIDRQIALIESGGTVRQETLHYNPSDRSLHARRSKEEADDYRYFPEPDLVPVRISSELTDALRAQMPELPAVRRARYRSDFGLSDQDAGDLTAAKAVGDYFEQVVAAGADPKVASDWVRNQPEVVDAVPAPRLAALIGLIAAGTLTSTLAKQVLGLMLEDPSRRARSACRAARSGSHRRRRRARRHGGRGDGREPTVRRAVPQRQRRRDQRADGPGDEENAGPRRCKAGDGAAAGEAVSRRALAILATACAVALGAGTVHHPPRRPRARRSPPTRGSARGSTSIRRCGPGHHPQRTIQTARAHGVKTLYVETSNYSTGPAIRYPVRLGQLIDQAHAAGIRVVGWYLPALWHIGIDLQRIRAAVDFRSPRGGALDSVAVDIESSAVADPAVRTQRLLTLATWLRAAVGPAYPLGAIIPSPRGMQLHPSYWPGFPYEHLADSFDVVLPMDYATYHVHTPARVVTYTRTSLRILRHRMPDPDLPIHEIGGLGPDSGKWMTFGFVKTALEEGVIGASLYDLPTTSPGAWWALEHVK